MPQTERERVDLCLSEAKENIGSISSIENRALANMAISLIEAIVRQVRDLDDDIWRLGDVVKETGGDLATVINGN